MSNEELMDGERKVGRSEWMAMKAVLEDAQNGIPLSKSEIRRGLESGVESLDNPTAVIRTNIKILKRDARMKQIERIIFKNEAQFRAYGIGIEIKEG